MKANPSGEDVDDAGVGAGAFDDAPIRFVIVVV